MKSLSTTTQNSIVDYIREGLSVKQTALKLGISKGTVSKYKNTHLPMVKPAARKRINIIPVPKLRVIQRDILSGKLKTAAEVYRELINEGYELSYMTVCRALRSIGFVARIKKKKPFLSKKHVQARYKWAKVHEHWTIEDWKKVVWSDETKINIWGSDGVKYYWSRPGDPCKPHHLEVTVKHGGGSLMMWGCMSYKGVGYSHHIQQIMNADVYCQILGTSLKGSLDFWDFSKDNIIFQQDNDPKHTSKKAKEWFKSEGITVLEWPAQSPDLNPIEHLWHHLKLKLSSYNTRAKGIHELWERCDKEWSSFTAEICQNYIESMPKRVQAVLKARGGQTKY
jgi:transposase